MDIKIVTIGLNKYTLIKGHHYIIEMKSNHEELFLVYSLGMEISQYKKLLSNRFNAKYNTHKGIMVLDYENAINAKDYLENIVLMNKLRNDFK